MATQAVVPTLAVNGEEFWQEREFAAVMKRNLRTIRLWDQLRIGPPRIKIGKTIFYRKTAVEQWLRANESRPCRVTRARRARRTEAA